MNLFKNKKMSKIEINCKNYSDFLIIGLEHMELYIKQLIIEMDFIFQ